MVLNGAGVTQVDRPAAAPQTGLYGLRVISVGSPGFIAGLTAATNLFGILPINPGSDVKLTVWM
jgi:hypothetical protein